jgi:hypothetical protein
MMMRVYALWRRDKRVLALMIVLWIAQVGFSGMSMGFTKRSCPFIPHPLLILRTHPRVLLFVLILPLAGAPLPPMRGFVGCILTGNGNLFGKRVFSACVTALILLVAFSSAPPSRIQSAVLGDAVDHGLGRFRPDRLAK